MAAAGKTCGGCGVCCKLPAIPELDKPVHTTCVHYVEAQGCSIYAERPGRCRAFECGYLQNPALGDEWRPDRAGFMLYFSEPGPRLVVETDLATPDTWRNDPYLSQLRQWARRDGGMVIEVVVRTGDNLTIVFPEGDVVLGLDSGLPIRSGYRLVDGQRTFFAEFAGD